MLRRANRRGPKCHREISCKKITRIQKFISFPEKEFQVHNNRSDHNSQLTRIHIKPRRRACHAKVRWRCGCFSLMCTTTVNSFVFHDYLFNTNEGQCSPANSCNSWVRVFSNRTHGRYKLRINYIISRLWPVVAEVAISCIFSP
jgi:hypothetical protein